MKVIIPAAGIGTRLRPHTYTVPKALLHVAGKPILAHIIDRLIGLDDIDEYLIVTGFFGGKVKSYVREHYDLNVRFVEQEELKGLGYAVYLACTHIDDGPVLVLLGDTILETDFDHFVQPGKDIIGVQEVDDPRRFGVVEAAGGKIVKIVEKPAEPKSSLAVVGIYGFDDVVPLKTALAEVVANETRTRGEIQITDALQLMIDRGAIMEPHTVGGWFDCGKLETLLETNRHLLAGFDTINGSEDSVIIPPAYISPTAEINRSVIGPYVSVGDGARVIESIVRDSIIGEKAKVRNCLLEKSMIGNRATVTGKLDHLNVGDLSEIGYR